MEYAPVRRVGGGPISTSALLFDLAARHLFTAAGSAVCVHSVDTGATLRRLEAHAALVTAVRLNPSNRLQLYSGSLDKTVRLWDYKDAVLLRTIELAAAVRGLDFLPSAPGVMLWWAHKAAAAVKRDGGKGRHGVLYRLSMPSPEGGAGPAVGVDSDVSDSDARAAAGDAGAAVGDASEMVFEGKSGRAWVADPLGRYVVGYGDHDWALVWPDTGETKTQHSGRKITCLACHPVDVSVAVGDAKGKITLWHAAASDKPVPSTYHWHAHGVSSVVFNSDGTYMLSGGEEAVLVIWQLETGVKRFLPRLGSPIIGLAISAHDTHYATVHEDNSAQAIDALSLKVIGQVQGVRRARISQPRRGTTCGLLVEPSTGHVVLNGTAGALQFYNLARDTVVKELQVVDRLFVSRTEDEEIFDTTVEKAAFSQDGEWLATVEYRDDGETECDVRLKFWRANGSKYTLNTSADLAHKKRITSLSVHPTEMLFVTTGDDARFKAWRLEESGGVNDQPVWKCLYVRSYLGMPCTSSAVSADGSLLAIGTGHFITLWNPLTCDMVQSIATVRSENVHGVAFTGKSSLVSYGANYLTVWNLLNCSVRWRIQVKVDHLCTSPTHTHFAVAPRPGADSKGQTVLEFTAENAAPVRVRHVRRHDAATAMTYFTAADAEDNEPELLLFDRDNTFKAFANGRESALEIGIKRILAPLASDVVDGAARRSYEALFGKHSTALAAAGGEFDDAVGEEFMKLDAVRGGKDPSQALFDVPAHVVPPIDMVAGSFMGLLLRKRKRTDADAPEAVVDSEDAASANGEASDVDEEKGNTVAAAAAVPASAALPDAVAGGSDLGFLVDFFKRGKTPEVLRNTVPSPGETKKGMKKRSIKGKKGGSVTDHASPKIKVQPVKATGLHPLTKRKKLKVSRKHSGEKA